MPHCFQSLHQLFNMNVATRLLVFTIAFALVQGNTSTLCPTGYNYNKSISGCECSPYLSDGVLCIDPGHAYLRIDYCMTLESLSNMSIAGNCHRGHYNHHQMIRGVYGLLPNDSSKLTDAQCKPNNRHGLLCAKCIDGYGVAVTPLTPKCIKCKFSPLPAILLYLTIELLPITAFFIVIVIFRINIMSGPLMGYFIFCQAYATTTNIYYEIYASLFRYSGPFTNGLLYLSYTLSSLWALCSFNILPPICISPRISLMDAIAMKCIRVLYPLVLVPITYFCIELHARNFKPVVYLWKPFSTCLNKVKIKLSTTDSIIHAFATLYFLSFAALNYISFKLLDITDLKREDGTLRKRRLISDPTVQSYSSPHAPYVAIAFGILFFLGVLPALVLCLYPIGTFRNALEHIISQRKRIILNTFVETLHSCFKDGLNGTRDYRSSLGIIMLVTILILLFNAHNTGHNSIISLVIMACVLIVIALIVAHIRPCKTLSANLSLTFHTTISSIICIQLTVWLQTDISINTKMMTELFAVLNFLPHILIALWLGYKVFSRKVRCHDAKTRVMTICRAGAHTILPHRLVSLRGYHNLN